MSLFGWGSLQRVDPLTGAAVGTTWSADSHSHSLSSENRVAEFALARDLTSVSNAILAGPTELSVEYRLSWVPGDVTHPIQAVPSRPFVMLESLQSLLVRRSPCRLYLYGYRVVEPYAARTLRVAQDGLDLVVSIDFRRIIYTRTSLTPGLVGPSLLALGL